MSQPPQEHLTGPGFWAMVAAATLKDFLDIFVNLSVVFAVFVFFTGGFLTFVIFLYLWLSDVQLDTKKLATLAFSALIEFMPFLSIIPAATPSLFLIRWFERKDYKKKIAAYEKHQKAAAAMPLRAAPSRA